MSDIEAYKKTFKDFELEIPDAIKGEIRDAFHFAENAHRNQERKSGEPYIIHPLEVGMSLWRYYKDKDLLVAGFLHDTVEDCEGVNIEDIYDQFGETVGFIVDALNKWSNSFYKYPDVHFDVLIDRLIWAAEKDFRVYLVKLADRKHNISTLHALNTNKQVNISFETQAIYLPLIDITQFEQNPDIVEAEKYKNKLFNDNGLSSLEEKKLFLMQGSFHNLDVDLFGLIQKDTKSVIWSLEDYVMFCRLTDDKVLSKNLLLDRIILRKNFFQARFRFTQKFELTKDIKIKPLTFTS